MKFKNLVINLINTCNYKCLFCRTAMPFNPQYIIRLDQFKDFESYVQMTEAMCIGGYGEITLHPDFERLINILTKNKVKIEMLTNGSMLTDDKIKILENSSLDILNISVNSLDRDNYKKLMGIDNLEKVLNNIDKVCKSELKNIQYLQCSFVINNINFHEIKNFIDFGLKYDINIRLTDLSANIKNYDPSLLLADIDENRKYLEECKEYAKQKNAKFYTFEFQIRGIENNGANDNKEELNKIIKSCDLINNTLTIDFLGNIFPCCWSHTLFGNIRTNSLDEIMNSELYIDFVKHIQLGSKKYCRNCRRCG